MIARMIGLIVIWAACVAASDHAEAQNLPPALALTCAPCHGTDGKSPGAVPAISGRSMDEIKEALTGFKNGTRTATMMNRLAKGYTEGEIRELAEYFSRIK